MAAREVPQSDWAAQLNTLGRHIGASSIVPIEVDGLLDAASSITGLSDYGDDGFREGLTALVDSLNKEAELTLTGRLIARTEISRILQSRLAIIDTEKKHPEIADEVIVEPLFIVGMGRTGSSILYEYFMQDPAHRAPVAWEKKLPAPALLPGDESQAAERIEWIEAETRLMYEIDSSLMSKHEAHARLPEECSQLMAHEFQSGHFFSRNNVPGYALWNAMSDVRPAYEMHKRILKILQWRDQRNVSDNSVSDNSASHKKPRWILKYGGHMGKMPELFETYPDAKVIHTHRDPSVVVQSMTSLIASLRLMRSDSFDAPTSAEMLNGGMARGLEKIIEERKQGVIPAAQIADIHFDRLMADTVAAIQQAYQQLEMPFTEAAKAAIEQYMVARPRTKHGKHEYAYADAVDIAHEKQRFANYMAHYQIAPEG